MNLYRLLLILLLPTLSFAQSTAPVEFVENRGQWNPRVAFSADMGGGAFFVEKGGFTVLQHHPDDYKRLRDADHDAAHGSSKKENITVRSHAYHVAFEGSNPAARIVPDKALPTYRNFFTGADPSKWAADCRVFQGITVKNLYPNIDLRYYSDRGSLKYDLIVHPGGNLEAVALRYNGAGGLDLRGGNLIIETSAGDLKEAIPYSFQIGSAGRTEVQARYLLKDSTVRFAVRNHDPKATLVIDPALVFASFSGSKDDNWGFTATYGPDGSMYGGGIVRGGANAFPVSPGAYQTTFRGGDWDIALIKLSPNGQQRAYATYLGGNGTEQVHSLIVDPQGNLVLAGRTNSTNFPVTGADGRQGGGGYEIIVCKLSAGGNLLLGSKVIGGSGDDGVNIDAERPGVVSLQQNYGDDGRSEVILDRVGNIYVASCTRSTNFPTRNGFQMASGGDQDGLLLKYDAGLNNLLFASYLGGAENDAAYVLSLNPSDGNIFVAGGTESDAFPGTVSAGTIGGRNRFGNIDGFISIVSPNGGSLIRSSYIGTGAIDQVYGIQFDRLGVPYIMGQTTGTFPVIRAPFSQPGGKQFIAKLQPDLSAYIYSTVFGKGGPLPDISPVAFLVDRCQNVYVSGWGGPIIQTEPNRYPSGGTNGLTTTPDAIKPTSPDGRDFYFFVLERNAASQLYGSFFGQDGGGTDHVDGGTSRFDANGIIYQAICANCKGLGAANFPTTPGVWSPTNPSNNCNLAMVKIAFNLAGVRGEIQSAINGVPRDTAGCVPLRVEFRDSVGLAQSYEWDFGDGSPQITTSRPDTAHIFTRTGSFRVMLVAIDSSTCNIRDTSFLTINVGDLEADLAFTATKLEPCQAFSYRFDNLSVAPGARPFTNRSFEWDFGDGSPRVPAGMAPVTHGYASPGTYNVKLFLVDSAYCNHPDSAVRQLRVAATVKAVIETPPTGCAPYLATFRNASQGGTRFIWDFGDGSGSTEAEPQHLYTAAGTYRVKLIAIDSATCNIIDSSFTSVSVFNNPVAGFSAAPQPPQVNVPITFTNTSSPDAIRFKWLWGDDDSLITMQRAPVSHEYNATGTFQATLIAFNAAGCSDTLILPVTTLIEPAVDVPNAFAPLSGGINSVVMVRGYGIAKMKFTIWSRWGQKVFESDSKRTGWNGYYNGRLMPMDAYAYTLEVEFFDGTRTLKKGDITLIR